VHFNFGGFTQFNAANSINLLYLVSYLANNHTTTLDRETIHGWQSLHSMGLALPRLAQQLIFGRTGNIISGVM
jgi:hypothetical protein